MGAPDQCGIQYDEDLIDKSLAAYEYTHGWPRGAATLHDVRSSSAGAQGYANALDHWDAQGIADWCTICMLPNPACICSHQDPTIIMPVSARSRQTTIDDYLGTTAEHGDSIHDDVLNELRELTLDQSNWMTASSGRWSRSSECMSPSRITDSRRKLRRGQRLRTTTDRFSPQWTSTDDDIDETTSEEQNTTRSEGTAPLWEPVLTTYVPRMAWDCQVCGTKHTAQQAVS